MSTFQLESEMRKAREDYQRVRLRYDEAMRKKDWQTCRSVHPFYMEAWNRYEAAAKALESALMPTLTRQ